MKKKVLLMTPVWESSKMWGRFEKGAGKYLPNNLLVLAAAVEREGFDVKFYDPSSFYYSEEQVAEYLKEHNFSVVGITAYTSAVLSAFRTTQLVKKILPDCKVILGGIHATLTAEGNLKECRELDAVCIGEGEKTFLEYVQHYLIGRPSSLSEIDGIAYRRENEIIRNKPREHIKDLSWLPMPAYHLVPMEKYIPPAANYYRLPTYTMYTGRGCPFNCAFCNSRDVFGVGGQKKRPIKNVVSEIKYLVKNHSAKGIHFYDGTFSLDRKWVKELCGKLTEEKIKIYWSIFDRCDTIDLETAKLMKKAGCWKVFIGIESANQKSLDLLNKHYTIPIIEKAVKVLRKANLQISASYILGLPGEDSQDCKRTIEFANRLGTNSAMFFIPIPMPHTKLMEECAKDGGVVGDTNNWERYTTFNLAEPIYVNPKIGDEKLREIYNYAYKATYTNYRIILKNLLSMRSFTDIKRNFSGFLAIKDFIKLKGFNVFHKRKT
jgi:radical SAM superfamily enzyme YgiQ (UPF0313 family)